MVSRHTTFCSVRNPRSTVATFPGRCLHTSRKIFVSASFCSRQFFPGIVVRNPWSSLSTTTRTRARAVKSVVNRYYDPTTDQFLSIDPSVAKTNQPFLFANDNPLVATDPLGLFAAAL